MVEPRKQIHPKSVDDSPERQGYILGQKANNYVRQLQLAHSLEHIQQGQKVKPLTNQLLLPGKKHPDLTWPVYIGEHGEAIAICTEGKLGKGAFGGVFVGVNLDTGEARAVKIQYPKDANELDSIKSEESVLTLLGRFEDRLEVKDAELANDFIETQYLKQLQGFYDVLIKLDIISESSFKALIVGAADPEAAAEMLVNTLLDNIQNKYDDDFSKFKDALLRNGGEHFVDKEIGIDSQHFLNITDTADFKELFKSYFEEFIGNINEEFNVVNEFMEIGAQDLAWGVNLIDYTEVEEHTDIEKLTVAIKVLEEIDALHQFRSVDAPNGLVHRDIKLANMMWDEENQKLTVVDMGFTRPMDSKGSFTDGKLRGTPCAIAPEAIIQMTQSEDPIFSAKTDMYAAGVLLLAMYSQLQVEIPFTSDENFDKGALEQAYEVQASLTKDPSSSGLPPVLQASVTDVLQDNVDDPLKTIYATIKKMIDINPAHRATFSEAIQTLKQVRADWGHEVIASPTQSEQKPKTHAVPQAAEEPSAEQKQYKALLDIGINQMKSLLEELQKSVEEPRAGSRKALLRQAPTANMRDKNEINHFIRQFTAMRSQDKINNIAIEALVKNFLSSSQVSAPVKAKLLVTQTQLKSELQQQDKENKPRNALKG